MFFFQVAGVKALKIPQFTFNILRTYMHLYYSFYNFFYFISLTIEHCVNPTYSIQNYPKCQNMKCAKLSYLEKNLY